ERHYFRDYVVELLRGALSVHGIPYMWGEIYVPAVSYRKANDADATGHNGAQVPAEALKTNSTLTTLNLRNNSIGDNGAVALAEALKINSALTTFNLKINPIRDNGAQALTKALKSNSTVII
ncbi:hypothetical protein BGZ47_003281, partial [Haplosporangium gracile]